jgi:hypothetical protein
MSAKNIIQAINQTQFSPEELNSLIAAVKHARSRTHSMSITQFSVGDNVHFEGRGGRTVTGVVMKVATKTVTVKTVEGLWRVAAGLLTRIVDEEEYA